MLNRERARRRLGWLKKIGLDLRGFVNAINAKRRPEEGIVEWNVAYRWFRDGRNPRALNMARIVSIFKDFPR